MNGTLKQMFFLIGYLFTATAKLLAEKPIYDKEFLNKFKDPEDKKKLNKAVEELKKRNSDKPVIINLKSGEKIKLVII